MSAPKPCWHCGGTRVCDCSTCLAGKLAGEKTAECVVCRDKALR